MEKIAIKQIITSHIKLHIQVDVGGRGSKYALFMILMVNATGSKRIFSDGNK